MSESSVIKARVVDYGGSQYSYNDGGLDAEIPSGDYFVINCEVGRPRENLIGITKVEARKATLSETVQFRDLCFLHEGTPSNILATPISTNDLTAHQCKATIGVIQEGYRAWLNNAPREVKAALQVAFTKEDEARDLMRQGTEFIPKGKFEEAKALITKGLTMYPEMGAAREYLGKISIDLGRISEAIKWFSDELNLAKEPEYLSAHLYLAAIYEAIGDMGQAEAHAQAAKATELYRSMPVALAPEVIQKICRVVQSSTVSTAARQDHGQSTEPNWTIITAEKRDETKTWWQFWK